MLFAIAAFCHGLREGVGCAGKPRLAQDKTGELCLTPIRVPQRELWEGQKTRIHSGKSPVPPPEDDSLPAFPKAVRVKSKTSRSGGKGLRPRWKEPDGTIYEWDSLHGTVEKYNARGNKHLGEFDPVTGKQLSDPNPKYKVEP